MILIQAIRLAATSTSASAATITGLLPPSSRVTGVRCGAAPSYDLAADLGAAGEEDAVQALRDQLLAPAPSPSTTAIASVSRYCGTSSAISRDDAGAISDGLSTTALPAAMRPDRRAQRQVERVVPGADDQHRAVGLVLHPAAAGQLRHLEQQVLAARPLAHLLGRVLSPRRRSSRRRR